MGNNLEKKFGVGSEKFGLGIWHQPLAEATETRDSFAARMAQMDRMFKHSGERITRPIEQMRYLVIGMIRIQLPSKKIK